MTSQRAAVAAAVTVGLLLAGCAGDDPAPSAARPTLTPDVEPVGPGPAPEGTTAVAPEEVWGLAQLVPPDDLVVTSSVRRPDPADLPSYLLVGSTGPDGVSALCEQLAQPEPAPVDALDSDQRAGWGLAEDPAGGLSVCAGPDPVVPSVQRELLVAQEGGQATVWLSAYDTPSP